MHSTPTAPSSVSFHFLEGGHASLTDRLPLRAFIASLFKKENHRLEACSYIFCSDEYLLTMNRQYLQHDYYTDIITFGLSLPREPINAEIYISVDRVKENAATFNSSFKRELHRVIFHGALHLCGYKDKKKADIALMRKMEDKYLRLYFKD